MAPNSSKPETTHLALFQIYHNWPPSPPSRFREGAPFHTKINSNPHFIAYTYFQKFKLWP
jgi:hypothetical protein